MAYIGNSPGVSSQRIVTTVTATAGQTTFTPSSGYTVGYLDVYLNGIKLINGTDYTASNGSTVVLTDAAALDDVVELMAYIPRGLSDGYTKSEADARYEPLDSAYTKAESDARYEPLDSAYTKAESDARYDATGAASTAQSAAQTYAAGLVDDLSGVTNASGARTNLGLGSLATKSTIGTTDITDGAVTAAKLAAGAAVPTQTGQSGKYLTTDGTTASWGTITQPTPAAVSDQANTSTGYFDLPAGTAAQRPGTPGTGNIRINTTTNTLEYYVGGSWRAPVEQYQVEILLIAGGGSGGTSGTNDASGGGGAGGVVAPQTALAAQNSVYTVVVGGGGARITSSNTNGITGATSYVTGMTGTTALGGGYGSGESTNRAAGNGGSGGGAGGYSGSPGSGTSGQGNNGAPVGTQGTGSAGGGGGAGAAATNMNGGAGTNAYSAWATATSTGVGGYYAGGGGGGGDQRNTAAAGNGGAGGGGSGASASSGQIGVNATVNTGSGGGGGAGSSYTGVTSTSGSGASGLVIIRYVGGQRGSGGTVATSGGYTYHTFTSSGTFTA